MSYIISVKDTFKNSIISDRDTAVLFDFSKANSSPEARVRAITAIASVCYANPNALDSTKLYNRLYTESIGLPSSSFEFVPVFIKPEILDKIEAQSVEKLNKAQINYFSRFFNYIPLKKWGCEKEGVITNLRNLIHLSTVLGDVSYLELFNTDSVEQEIINEHFDVFLIETSLVTRSQFMRHRTFSYQELSRRYTSNNKVPFTFSKYTLSNLSSFCLGAYDTLVKNTRAEEARHNIPQGAITHFWVAMPNIEDKSNFYRLRTGKHAQTEIRELSENMLECLFEKGDSLLIQSNTL
jgi:thymidylate synthase (FAD)